MLLVLHALQEELFKSVSKDQATQVQYQLDRMVLELLLEMKVLPPDSGERREE